jgi:hypothetical protein
MRPSFLKQIVCRLILSQAALRTPANKAQAYTGFLTDEKLFSLFETIVHLLLYHLNLFELKLDVDARIRNKPPPDAGPIVPGNRVCRFIRP